MKKAVKIVSRTFAVLGITLGFIFLTLIIMIKMICSNISGSAKELFATTMLETGQLKFVTKIFLSKEEIQKLVDQNSMATMNTEMDTDLIHTDNKEEDFDKNGIQLE